VASRVMYQRVRVGRQAGLAEKAAGNFASSPSPLRMGNVPGCEVAYEAPSDVTVGGRETRRFPGGHQLSGAHLLRPRKLKVVIVGPFGARRSGGVGSGRPPQALAAI
jgi:hypothetical protein